MLSSEPAVKSVVLHRSTATGEIDFGRSDIDLLLVVHAQKAEEDASITSLYDQLSRARRFNPALTDIDVYEPDAIATHAEIDSSWASTERRTERLLRGDPVEIPFVPVNPDHALSRFLLWVEWFFAVSVQQRNARNLRKLSLECWNAYASAERLIEEPWLLRSEMAAHASRTEANLSTEQLADPAYATRFVFELADRLHSSRLPALRKLDQPLIFEVITAPLGLRRLFVVLPNANSPMPQEAFTNGAFTCTPEILDLFVHAKNAFLHWSLPPDLLRLGIQPPLVAEFVGSCRYYNHSRFLFHPGFANPNRPTQSARIALVKYAMDSASRGKLPAPIPESKIQEMLAAGAPTVTDYYRTEYARLRRDSRSIEEALRPLASAPISW
jgi:hypothetical protein